MAFRKLINNGATFFYTRIVSLQAFSGQELRCGRTDPVVRLGWQLLRAFYGASASAESAECDPPGSASRGRGQQFGGASWVG